MLDKSTFTYSFLVYLSIQIYSEKNAITPPPINRLYWDELGLIEAKLYVYSSWWYVRPFNHQIMNTRPSYSNNFSSYFHWRIKSINQLIDQLLDISTRIKQDLYHQISRFHESNHWVDLVRQPLKSRNHSIIYFLLSWESSILSSQDLIKDRT